MSESAIEGADGANGGESGAAAPRVWVLLDDRPGNSTQSLGLADELGWPYSRVDLALGVFSKLHNRWLGASLRGLRRATRENFEAPWPDLVIAAGRRTAPVARWIRAASAGRTRLVQLGRKGADVAADFDLCVTPRYTRQRAHPNRIETTGPLHRIRAGQIAAEASARRAEWLGDPPGTKWALLVGGTSGQYRLDRDSARRLGEAVAAAAREAGVGLLVSVSRRTGDAAAEALCEGLGPDALVYRFRPGDDANPYLAFLGLADAFVITGDSESMLVEACATGKPVWIYPLPVRFSFRLLQFAREWVVRHSLPQRARGLPVPGLEALCEGALERGYVRPSRNLDRMHFDLCERGLARPFGRPWDIRERAGGAEAQRAAPDERARVAAAVRRLFDESPPPA